MEESQKEPPGNQKRMLIGKSIAVILEKFPWSSLMNCYSYYWRIHSDFFYEISWAILEKILEKNLEKSQQEFLKGFQVQLLKEFLDKALDESTEYFKEGLLEEPLQNF